ncbi:hypothetical protein V6N13_070252 [Hibiscus sabdariffa]
MDGLQPWAKTELKRRGVQDLADAIAVAESLIDYTSRKESTPKPKDKRIGQAKGGGDKGQRKEAHQDDNPPRYKESSAWKGKAKAKDFRGSKKPSSNKCFICDGDHWVRECPQRQALNSLLAQHQGGDGDKGKEGAHMGSLQLLNVIQSAPKTETKGLIYVDVTINEKTTRAMLDTGRGNAWAVLPMTPLPSSLYRARFLWSGLCIARQVRALAMPSRWGEFVTPTRPTTRGFGHVDARSRWLCAARLDNVTPNTGRPCVATVLGGVSRPSNVRASDLIKSQWVLLLRHPAHPCPDPTPLKKQ